MGADSGDFRELSDAEMELIAEKVATKLATRLPQPLAAQTVTEMKNQFNSRLGQQIVSLALSGSILGLIFLWLAHAFGGSKP